MHAEFDRRFFSYEEPLEVVARRAAQFKAARPRTRRWCGGRAGGGHALARPGSLLRTTALLQSALPGRDPHPLARALPLVRTGSTPSPLAPLAPCPHRCCAAWTSMWAPAAWATSTTCPFCRAAPATPQTCAAQTLMGAAAGAARAAAGPCWPARALTPHSACACSPAPARPPPHALPCPALPPVPSLCPAPQRPDRDRVGVRLRARHGRHVQGQQPARPRVCLGHRRAAGARVRRVHVPGAWMRGGGGAGPLAAHRAPWRPVAHPCRTPAHRAPPWLPASPTPPPRTASHAPNSHRPSGAVQGGVELHGELKMKGTGEKVKVCCG